MKAFPAERNLFYSAFLYINIILRVSGLGVNENLVFRVLKPQSLGFHFTIRPAKNFGGTFNFFYERIPLVAADPLEACGEIQNAEEIRGNVALVRRGECSFLSKSIVADRAGAQMVIIFDSDEKNDFRFIDMIDDETHRAVSVPTAFMLGRDGNRLAHYLTTHGGSIEIAIPVNTTGMAYSHLSKPPWTLW